MCIKGRQKNKPYCLFQFTTMCNNRKNKHRTLLEHLPIEIFLQIFVFFPLDELVKSFFGLSSYIDSLIRSVRNANHMIIYNNNDAINLLHSFSSQINRLVIIHSESVDFKSLINLRSLTLKYGTHAQFNSIRPQYFPMLEILHICSINLGECSINSSNIDFICSKRFAN